MVISGSSLTEKKLLLRVQKLVLQALEAPFKHLENLIDSTFKI